MEENPKNSVKESRGRIHIGSYVQKGGINPDPKSRIKERPDAPKPIRTRLGVSPGKKTKKK